MKFALPTAELYIPDGAAEAPALARTTHLAVGAHQDDLEIMAFDGIIRCFQQEDKWFTGVVVTNGSGSARTGVYEKYTDAEMVTVRRKEQKKAAHLGDYAAQFLLDHPSSAIKDPKNAGPVDDLEAILRACAPEVVYTHNLADKHDTHVGVALRLVKALREIAGEYQPEAVWGCEVWRDLDWLNDDDKVLLDCTPHENLAAAVMAVYDSQICGGKRYDLATAGRRKAHATYHASHGIDESQSLNFGMDLTPLLKDPSLTPVDLLNVYIANFQAETNERVAKLG